MAKQRGLRSSDQHALLLGERLRRVRRQQGLSLLDVEQLSDGALKASVLGAYERGERTISITRLSELSEFYRVPVAELLPDPTRRAAPEPPEQDIVIDLAALERVAGQEAVVARYIDAIRVRRGDYNRDVLTVRAADLVALATVLDSDPQALRERLRTEGVLR